MFKLTGDRLLDRVNNTFGPSFPNARGRREGQALGATFRSTNYDKLSKFG